MPCLTDIKRERWEQVVVEEGSVPRIVAAGSNKGWILGKEEVNMSTLKS